MTGALIILAVTALIGVILYVSDRLYFKPREAARRAASAPREETPQRTAKEEPAPEGECCGMHIVCEKDSLSPFTREADYYDDEELDRFRGRDADSYSPEETEEFRDIMLTMRVDEIAGWVRSLSVRGVTLPSEIREEVLLIVGEAREARLQTH